MPPVVYLRKSPEERFWAKVNKTAYCWLWTGCHTPAGYGTFWRGGTMIGAHRFSYELLRAPIPPNLEIDHLCRIPGCVNPQHLEPVTRIENAHRGLKGVLLTHCKHGHRYTPAMTIVTRQGYRNCRICKRARDRARATQ